MKTFGDLIIVGDLARSVSLFILNPQSEIMVSPAYPATKKHKTVEKIKLIASDLNTRWITDVCFLGDNENKIAGGNFSIAAADNNGNLLIFEREEIIQKINAEELGKERKSKLKPALNLVSSIHIGSNINRLAPGCLTQVLNI
jgi:hypothetical protein